MYYRFGTNVKRIPKINSLLSLILDAASDSTLILLMVLGVVNGIGGVIQHDWDWKSGWIDGAAILAAVALIIAITSGNNYSKEKQFQKLVAKAEIDYVPVYRGGSGLTQTLAVSELVAGDLIKLSEGNRIPADCVLIDGTDISTDESGLTGEPEHMEKTAINQENYDSNPDPFLLAKTLICKGQGLAIVCCVGTNSRSGMAEEKL